MENRTKFYLGLFLAILVAFTPISFAMQMQEELNNNNSTTNKLYKTELNKQEKSIVFLPFVGLAAEAVTILLNAGITYIAVGGAVLVGTLVVSHVGTTTWIYYFTNYTTLSDSAYKHTADFKNIFGTRWVTLPGGNDKEKTANLCKDIINKKFSLSVGYSTAIQNGKEFVRVAQLYNGKYISVIGKEDGKTIFHCSPDNKTNMTNKIKAGTWKVLDGFMKTWK